MSKMAWIKKHLFLLSVVSAYIILFCINSDYGIRALDQSQYYIVEMIQIMPPIFVLTALLEMWMPKEMISNYLGEEAKGKGIILSFLMGSLSAGPIYSAFPVCVMLLKKGASVRNIVIILSSWAVIKIPMLLNEIKFLGVEFMVIRWILTVIAIVIIASLTHRVIKKNEIIQDKEDQPDIHVEIAACIGCGICVKKCPQVFNMNHKKAQVRLESVKLSMEQGNLDYEKLAQVSQLCPAKAIYVRQKEDH